MEDMQGFHIIVKPAGPICNLNCAYCYYLEKKALFGQNTDFRMGHNVLEALISKYITSSPAPEVTFSWQGGEPVLAGLEFFEKAVLLEKKYAGAKHILNTFQTNGTLITEEWCEFFARHNFLVGISLDGPRDIHDRHRVDKNGDPTFDKVMHGVDLLKRYNVEFNVLAAVTRESSERPLDIYRFFKREGVKFIQFLPVVERQPGFAANKLGLCLALPPRLDEMEPERDVTSWSVEPEPYGDFLIKIFDEWVENDVGTIFVSMFDLMTAAWMGFASNSCFFSKQCGKCVAVEHNGDMYACDHFVYPEYRIGNILDNTPAELINSEKQRTFGARKETMLPGGCRACKALFACYGECPKHRFLISGGGEQKMPYLCKGYKKFFTHINRDMKGIAGLISNGLDASHIMKARKGSVFAYSKTGE
jgi:uncharacterized protein